MNLLTDKRFSEFFIIVLCVLVTLIAFWVVGLVILAQKYVYCVAAAKRNMELAESAYGDFQPNTNVKGVKFGKYKRRIMKPTCLSSKGSWRQKGADKKVPYASPEMGFLSRKVQEMDPYIQSLGELGVLVAFLINYMQKNYWTSALLFPSVFRSYKEMGGERFYAFLDSIDGEVEEPAVPYLKYGLFDIRAYTGIAVKVGTGGWEKFVKKHFAKRQLSIDDAKNIINRMGLAVPAKLAKFALLPFLIKAGVDPEGVKQFYSIYEVAIDRIAMYKDVYTLLTSLLELAENFIPAFISGDWSKIRIETGPVLWMRQAMSLKHRMSKAVQSTLSVKMTLEDATLAVDNLIKTSEFYSGHPGVGAKILSMCSELQNDLTRFKAESTVGTLRMTPFGIALVGKPNVGKSVLYEAIAAKFMRLAYNRNILDSDKYLWQGTEFADGYVCQKCVILDDLDSERDPNKQGTASVMQLVNPVTVMTNQAAVENKGMFPFMGELVIATSNTTDLGFNKRYRHVEAACRRFPWHVTVVPAPFVNLNGSLDLSKISADDAPKTKDSYHHFHVSKWNGLEWSPLTVFESRCKFLDFIGKQMVLHRERESRRSAVQYCDHGNAQESCSQCNNFEETESTAEPVRMPMEIPTYNAAESRAPFINPRGVPTNRNGIRVSTTHPDDPVRTRVYDQDPLGPNRIRVSTTHPDDPRRVRVSTTHPDDPVRSRVYDQDPLAPNRVRVSTTHPDDPVRTRVYEQDPLAPHRIRVAQHDPDRADTVRVAHTPPVLDAFEPEVHARREIGFSTLFLSFSNGLSSLAAMVMSFATLKLGVSMFSYGETLDQMSSDYTDFRSAFLRLYGWIPSSKMAAVSAATLLALKVFISTFRDALATAQALKWETLNISTGATYPDPEFSGYKKGVVTSADVAPNWETGLMKGVFELRGKANGSNGMGKVFAVQLRPKLLVTVAHFFKDTTDWELLLPNGDSVPIDDLTLRMPFGDSHDIAFFCANTGTNISLDSKMLQHSIDSAISIRYWNPQLNTFVQTGEAKRSWVRSDDGNNYNLLKFSGQSYNGMCGSPVLANVLGKWFFVGIHSHGTPNDNYAATFPSNISLQLDNWYPSLRHKRVVPQKGWLPTQELEKLEKRGAADIPVPTHGIVVSSSNAKTVFYPTGMQDKIVSTFGVAKYCPAPLKSGSVINGKYINNSLTTMYKLVTNTKNLKFYFVNHVIDAYFMPYLREHVTHYKRLSLAESVYGLYGCVGYTSLNMQTSGGYGFTGKKSGHIRRSDDTFEISDLLLASLKEHMAIMEEGTIIKWQCVTTAKDELLKEEKVLLGKHRLFQVFPAPAVILGRCAILSIIAQLTAKAVKTGIGIGTNCMSSIWKDMYRIFSKDAKIWCADAAGWDTSLGIMPDVCDALLRHISTLGISKTDYNFLSSALGSVTTYMGTAMGLSFDVSRGMPSGHPFTAMGNSLAHILLLMCVYEYSVGDTGNYESWKKDMVVYVYGDDSIVATTNPKVTPSHHKKIFEMAGMQLQREDKQSGEIEPVTSFQEISFLKRKFIEYGECVFAPLEKSSIFKGLQYFREGLPKDMMEEVAVRNAAKELVLHLDPECYQKLAALYPHVHIPSYAEALELAVQGVKEGTYTTWESDVRQVTLLQEDLLEEAVAEMEKIGMIPLNSTKQSREAWLALEVYQPNTQPLNPEPEGGDFRFMNSNTQFSVSSSDTEKLESPSVDINTNAVTSLAPSRVGGEMFDNIIAASLHTDTSPDTKFPGASQKEIIVALERPVYLATTSGLADYYTTDPRPLWASNEYINTKLRYWNCYKYDLTIRLVVSTSPYNYGRAIMAFVPFGREPASITFQELVTTQYSQIVDLAVSKSYEITIPFFHPLSAYGGSTEYDDLYYGNFHYKVLSSSVGNSQSVDASPIGVEIYLIASNISLLGPQAASQMKRTEKPTTSSGIISGPMNFLSNVASKLVDIPIIGRYAKATTIGAGAVSNIAKIFGFSSPLVLATMKTGATSLGLVDVPYPGGSLALSGNNELGLHTTRFDGDADTLSVASIGRRWGTLYAEDWSAESVTNTRIFTLGVTPRDGFHVPLPGEDSQYYNTPVSFVSSFARYWRGDLEYTFDFACNRFHRGRVLIYWTPVAHTGAFHPENVMPHAPCVVHDLSAGSTVTLVVPYMHTKPWLLTSKAEFVSMEQELASSFYNGFLCMVVLTPLSPPVDITLRDSISVHVYMRAGENFMLACPSMYETPLTVSKGQTPNAFTGFDTVLSFPTNQNINPELMAHDGTYGGYAYAVRQIAFDTTPIVMSDSRNPDDGVLVDTIGEAMPSLRLMAKRPQILWSMTLTSGRDCGIPVKPMSFINTIDSSGTTTLDGARTQNVLSRLAEVFVGWRGTIRFHEFANTAVPGQYIFRAKAHAPFYDTGTFSSGSSRFMQLTAPVTSFLRRSTDQAPALSFDVPYYRPYYWDYCEPHKYFVDRIEDTVVFRGGGATNIFYSAGEDFNFCIWNYLPEQHAGANVLP